MAPQELYKGSARAKGLGVDILRNGPIVVSAADDFIHLTVPVTISLSGSIFETPAVAARLMFKVNATVTPDWRIVADVHYVGLSDLPAEEIVIGPLSIKPRSIIERNSQPLQRLLSGLVSRKLNEKFPLKTQAATVWDAARKPLLLDENLNAWLLITPREVLLYPFHARDNQVKLSVGLESLAELVVGPAPPARPPVPLPDLKPASGPERTFRIVLHTDLFYKDIVSIAAPRLLGKDFGRDGKRVILQDLDLYGNGDRLVIKAATTGDFDGIIYLGCRPVFNPQTSLFSVEDVDFDLQTQNLLLQSAGWLLHGSIRSTIQERLNMDLTSRLEQAREMAGKALARVKLAENVFLTGSVTTMKLNDVMVQKEKISIQVYAEGEAAIVLH